MNFVIILCCLKLQVHVHVHANFVSGPWLLQSPSNLSLFSQSLLENRLVYEGCSHGNSDLLLAQMKVVWAGCDFVTMETLRIRSLAPVSLHK